MWYRHPPPSENLVKRLFPPPHPHQRTQEQLRRLEYYSRWTQCQYLALNTASGYASGLTVCLDPNQGNLTGIIAHGHSKLALGRPKGIPIHLPLKRGEHLTSAWLHVSRYYYGIIDCFSVSHYLLLHVLHTDWTLLQGHDEPWTSTSLRQL